MRSVRLHTINKGQKPTKTLDCPIGFNPIETIINSSPRTIMESQMLSNNRNRARCLYCEKIRARKITIIQLENQQPNTNNISNTNSSKHTISPIILDTNSEETDQ